jgi:hypothetical protein
VCFSLAASAYGDTRKSQQQKIQEGEHIFMRSARKWGVSRVRRLALLWGSAAEAAGLLAFSFTGQGASTSTSTASAPTGNYQVMFQANSSTLYRYAANGAKSPITLGMQAGTSPATAQLPDGAFESAFQGKDNDLYLHKWNGTKISTTLRMDPGTSPVLAGLPVGGGWVAAFQARNHHLYIYTSAGSRNDTGLRMKPGTSPAIAVQPNDAWKVAFTGRDGKLNTYDSAGNITWTANAMDTASSPSIAALADGSYEVAFEARNNSLGVYRTGGSTYRTGFSMEPGTSPSIASQPDGDWAVAFQAGNHELGTVDAAGNSLKVADSMRTGASPSIAPEPDGSYEIAFEARNNFLGVYRTGVGTYRTGLRMDPGTNPSAAITTPAPPAISSPNSKIVSIAESQIGYRDDPVGSYCNPYSAYWGSGNSCSQGNYLSEEWCADFVAWVWHRAGVPFTYGYDSGEINGGAVSFYQWGVANGTWHAVNSGYTPQPGDAVLYGLNTPTDTSADHVAVVTGGTARDPNVVDGDWWLGNNGGNGGVVAATDQTTATGTDSVSGYVSPWRAHSSAGKGDSRRHQHVRRTGRPRTHGQDPDGQPGSRGPAARSAREQPADWLDGCASAVGLGPGSVIADFGGHGCRGRKAHP